MSEMMATANAKSIEEIKSFLSRQKEVYKIPYETHPADRPRQCVFGGTSNALDFLPLDRSGNRRFIPVMVYPEQAEVHILEDEAASRAYPKTKNVLAKTKKECVEKLQKLKEECSGLKPEKVRSEMPFGDWLTYWYENHSKPKIRPTTQETYESRIRLHIIPEIGDIPLNKLTQNDLQQFYGRLKKSGRKRFTDKYGEGLSDRMVRMCHATCRSALEQAVQDGLIRVNPALGCKLPPKKARGTI